MESYALLIFALLFSVFLCWWFLRGFRTPDPSWRIMQLYLQAVSWRGEGRELGALGSIRPPSYEVEVETQLHGILISPISLPCCPSPVILSQRMRGEENSERDEYWPYEYFGKFQLKTAKLSSVYLCPPCLYFCRMCWQCMTHFENWIFMPL